MREDVSVANAQKPRYPETARRRMALAPGVIGALGSVWAGALLGQSGGGILLYVVAIFALICAWFAWQARQWWWLPPLLVIAVLWNPVWPFAFSGQLWIGAHYLAAAVFIAVGLLVRVLVEPDRPNPGRGAGSDRNGAQTR